jgi:hypothetical protein
MAIHSQLLSNFWMDNLDGETSSKITLELEKNDHYKDLHP